MIALLFPLPDVLAVARHAVDAPQHASSCEPGDCAASAAALYFFGDEGIYLMSNGIPLQIDPADRTRQLKVYADGYRTRTDRQALRDVVGEDDFGDELALLDSPPGSPSLYAQLNAGAEAGASHLVLDMDRTRLQWRLTGASAGPAALS